MASIVPAFTEQQIQRIARIVGDTQDGFSGSEIGVLLAILKFPDEGPVQTKWKRIFNSLVELHYKYQVGNHTVMLLNAAMNPERYIANREIFKTRQEQLNTVLAFAGYYVRDDGRIGATTKASTLDEAFTKANKPSQQLKSRGVHEEVLAFCNAELIQSNYFHAVFEAMKSIKNRINEMSGIDGDGASLVDEAFGVNQGAVIAINGLTNSTDEGDSAWFAIL